jgi:hypothetical protein
MPKDAFDRYMQQRVELDLEQFIGLCRKNLLRANDTDRLPLIFATQPPIQPVVKFLKLIENHRVDVVGYFIDFAAVGVSHRLPLSIKLFQSQVS